jgi:hypothetical protein
MIDRARRYGIPMNALRLGMLCIMLTGGVVVAGNAPASGSPAPGESVAVDLMGLFYPPVALVDQEGKTIVTKRAGGHLAVMDWNADGKNDLVLGCHAGMDTPQAEILLLENVGTSASPKFRWPTEARVMAGKEETSCSAFSSSCGCKSGGAFEVAAWDANGDSRPDLIVNTFWTRGVVLLRNTGVKDSIPVFTQAEQLFEVGQKHGRGSGGGDWNNDGIPDYVHPVNRYGWTVNYGMKLPGGGIGLNKKALNAADFKLTGNENYGTGADGTIWFDRTPYAWNFSGKHGPDSPVTEVVAVMYQADYNETKNYAAKKCDVNLYLLDRDAKTCVKQATLAVNAAATTRLGMGDLDGDGVMDLLYTGGTFNKDGAGTKLWWLRGRQKAPGTP